MTILIKIDLDDYTYGLMADASDILNKLWNMTICY